jgi:hypothetical protein
LEELPAIKLECNSQKYTNNWRLNNTLLSDQWIIEEIREEIKRFLEVNEKEKTTYTNIWDTANTVLKGKFIGMSAYITTERYQINNLKLHVKLLEKYEQAKPKTSRRRGIIKIWAEAHEIHTKKPYKESIKQKVGSMKQTRLTRPW